MDDGQVQTVAFDLGGVFFTSGTRPAVKEMFEILGLKDDRARFELERALVGGYRDVGADYRMGKLSRDQFWSIVRERVPFDEDLVSKLEEVWFSHYVPNEGVPELVEELKDAGYFLVAFSGNVKERVEWLDRKYNFRRLFDEEVYSYDWGLDKEMVEFYEVLLDRVRGGPAATVLVDDYEKYCRVARRLGMRALRFTGSRRLRADLAALGVEVTRSRPP